MTTDLKELVSLLSDNEPTFSAKSGSYLALNVESPFFRRFDFTDNHTWITRRSVSDTCIWYIYHTPITNGPFIDYYRHFSRWHDWFAGCELTQITIPSIAPLPFDHLMAKLYDKKSTFLIDEVGINVSLSNPYPAAKTLQVAFTYRRL